MILDLAERPTTVATARHSHHRVDPVSALVLHTTEANTAASTISWFARPESRVSAHVLIDRDGTIYRCVPDNRVAWHAGRSVLAHEAGVNEFSLGVELVGKGRTYPELQLDVSAAWCADAIARYRIPLNRVVGHVAIAVPMGRRSDPVDFPWYDWFQRVVAHLLD